jgi:hypothetical protein
MKNAMNLSTLSGKIRWQEHGSGRQLLAKSNLIAFGAADVLARVLAGETALRPSYVGFLYGAAASPPDIVDPDTLSGDARRAIRLSDLRDACQANSANIAVAALTGPPAAFLAPGTDGDRYARNTVHYSAHTGMVSEHLFPLGTGGFAAALSDLETAYVYQVVLLSREPSGTFLPFAISQLGVAPFVARAAGREQAVLWDIEFK